MLIYEQELTPSSTRVERRKEFGQGVVLEHTESTHGTDVWEEAAVKTRGRVPPMHRFQSSPRLIVRLLVSDCAQ